MPAVNAKRIINVTLTGLAWAWMPLWTADCLAISFGSDRYVDACSALALASTGWALSRHRERVSSRRIDMYRAEHAAEFELHAQCQEMMASTLQTMASDIAILPAVPEEKRPTRPLRIVHPGA